VLVGERLYQLVIVPVLSPLPVAWVAVGFSVNDALAQDLRKLTALHVSFLSHRSGEPWRIQASTLPELSRAKLLSDSRGRSFRQPG
jgi:hypothetical protein